MKTRMQPIGNVWAKFPRVVRDLSSQLGKQVRIEMEGKDTELDKTIVEAIKDPLTHLIRNAVDHGVENPDFRTAAGKPAEGRLFLRAYHEGGQVNIEISDDGAGLNLDRIRKKAIERGLVTADQAGRMNDREVSQLVLLPGFSTAEKVTSVSGRGVGMDVVKTNIERIGGTIDMQSQPGYGTTVRIKIPLTLAIIPALIVSCGGDRYAIPQVSLLELVRLEKDQAEKGIEYVHGAPVFRLRGKLLPLVYLSERLNLQRGDDAANDEGIINIVVLRANDRHFGLVVDKINDTEEIVVKPLSQQLKGLGEYAGATIMGDGTVALILDVMGLALASGLIDALRDQGVTSMLSDESKRGDQTETLLVIDLGDMRRFALPISMISRLEKVPTSAIEFADGREVIQYRGAILPLVRLADVFQAESPCDQAEDELKIIVYADESFRCGLVVQRIIDIVETKLDFATKENEDNLLGTAVIQKRVTDVLNLRRLARERLPVTNFATAN
jgi:two-component system chemotaxis sensor kinase CheA